MSEINIPIPILQIDFFFALSQLRDLCLQDALGRTVEEDVDLETLDKELTEHVPLKSLGMLARQGLVRAPFGFG